MKFAGILASMAGLLYGATANTIVMRDIIENIAELEARGYYKQDEKPPSILGQPQDCVDNKVILGEETFDCKEVDFYSFLSLADLEIPELEHQHGFRTADIWGWKGPSGREFTLLCLDNGVAVIDSTDPIDPCIIAKMPTGRYVDIWGDVKVVDNTMYHVKDKRFGDDNETRGYGMEVYDLLPLDQLDCKVDGYVPLKVYPNYVFNDHGRSHNVISNPESGRLYSVGTEQCAGGFMVIDTSDRLEPTQIGCVDGDGYTHDAQCLIYDGPDPDHQGKEICFGFNENTLTTWDLTDPVNPIMLSRIGYPNQVYSHQGWVNDDLTKVLLDDEIDERCNNGFIPERCAILAENGLTGVLTTSTNVIDITDLDNPFYVGAYIHPDLSIDHNLYVWGTVHRKGWGGNPPVEFYPDPNFAYMNNYLAGLKIVDITSSDYTEWTEAGYFDISPDLTEIAYAGAWSGYMHPSGVYAISSIERGVFFLQPRMAFTENFPAPPAPAPPTAAPVAGPVSPPVALPTPPVEPGTDGVEEALLLIIVAVALALLAVVLAMMMFFKGRTAASAATGQQVTTKNLAFGGPVVEDM